MSRRDFKFTFDVIEIALRRTTSKVNPSFDYIDKLLTDWHDRGFTTLKDAKEEHKKQGLIYLYCLEERRKYLHEKYKTREDFFSATSKVERIRYFESKYQHMKDGSHYTREEKIENEVKLNMIADDILYETNKPITKVVFLYENKNNQELKEYVVERNVTTESILKLNQFLLVEKHSQYQIDNDKIYH